jgi:hypothetical protein
MPSLLVVVLVIGECQADDYDYDNERPWDICRAALGARDGLGNVYGERLCIPSVYRLNLLV